MSMFLSVLKIVYPCLYLDFNFFYWTDKLTDRQNQLLNLFAHAHVGKLVEHSLTIRMNMNGKGLEIHNNTLLPMFLPCDVNGMWSCRSSRPLLLSNCFRAIVENMTWLCFKLLFKQWRIVGHSLYRQTCPSVISMFYYAFQYLAQEESPANGA